MSRQTKTPRQRAEEALALADRKVKRLSAEKAKLAHELEQVTGDHDLAVVRRDYLAQHPDLRHPGEEPATTSTGATT